MPALPEFLYSINETELPGVRLILFTGMPYFIGKVLQFKKEEEFLNFKDRFNRVITLDVYSEVRGYRIVVLYFGSLTKIQQQDRKADIEDILQKMAEFYFSDKIDKNPIAYKRYKR